MAKKHFLVIEDSFIGMRLIKADAPVEQRVVHIEVDPEEGGMTPASNLVECDEAGNPIVTAKPKPGKAKVAAAPKAPAGGVDAGGDGSGGDGSDLA